MYYFYDGLIPETRGKPISVNKIYKSMARELQGCYATLVIVEHFKVVFQNYLKGRDHSEDLEIDGNIMLDVF
jgi:hypothetical protein